MNGSSGTNCLDDRLNNGDFGERRISINPIVEVVAIVAIVLGVSDLLKFVIADFVSFHSERFITATVRVVLTLMLISGIYKVNILRLFYQLGFRTVRAVELVLPSMLNVVIIFLWGFFLNYYLGAKVSLDFSTFSVFYLVVSIGIWEEILFRGYALQQFLRNYSVNQAILFSALIWSLMHLNNIIVGTSVIETFGSVANALLVALPFSLIYILSGRSIVGLIPIHITLDLIVKLDVQQLSQTPYFISIAVAGAAMYIGLFLSIWLLYLRSKKINITSHFDK